MSQGGDKNVARGMTKMSQGLTTKMSYRIL